MGREWVGQRINAQQINALARATAGIALAAAACSPVPGLAPVNEPPRKIQIQQSWQLQAGDFVKEYRIAAGLGDISIALKGGKVYAPFEGRVQPNVTDCVLFSTPEVPAYLFRFCGLSQPRLGLVKQGDSIGSGEYLHFAMLRKLPEGTWTIVEPSRSMLEKILSKP
jgi:hypothetical protein